MWPRYSGCRILKNTRPIWRKTNALFDICFYIQHFIFRFQLITFKHNKLIKKLTTKGICKRSKSILEICRVLNFFWHLGSINFFALSCLNIFYQISSRSRGISHHITLYVISVRVNSFQSFFSDKLHLSQYSIGLSFKRFQLHKVKHE